MPGAGTSQRRVLVLGGLGQGALCSEWLSHVATSLGSLLPDPRSGPGLSVPLRVPPASPVSLRTTFLLS